MEQTHATCIDAHVQCIDADTSASRCNRMQRLERLKAVRWNSRSLPPGIAVNCSPQELEVRRGCGKLDCLQAYADGNRVLTKRAVLIATYAVLQGV